MKDFPDPVNGEPLIDTYKIPSSNKPGGMTILNAAMHKCGSVLQEVGGRPGVTRKRWALAAAAVLVAAICGVVVMSGAEHPAAAAPAPAANTVKVEKGELSAMVSRAGTLTYRARSDGSPYPVINQARGVYTSCPTRGQGRLRRRALPGGRPAGGAAVRHGPGLPWLCTWA